MAIDQTAPPPPPQVLNSTQVSRVLKVRYGQLSNPIVSSVLVSEESVKSFFGYSPYINLLPCAIISAPTKTKVDISCSQTSKAHTSWSPSPFCRLCKKGEGFQPRLRKVGRFPTILFLFWSSVNFCTRHSNASRKLRACRTSGQIQGRRHWGKGGQMPPSNNFDNAVFDFYKLGKMLKSINSVVI